MSLFSPRAMKPVRWCLLEALASGLPVITAPSAGGAEIVTQDVGFLLPDSEDVDGLAASMMRLADDDALRRGMRNAARPHGNGAWLASDGAPLFGPAGSGAACLDGAMASQRDLRVLALGGQPGLRPAPAGSTGYFVISPTLFRRQGSICGASCSGRRDADASSFGRVHAFGRGGRLPSRLLQARKAVAAQIAHRPPDLGGRAFRVVCSTCPRFFCGGNRW